MRISLQWLSEWIGGPLPAPKDLAARLTMAGLEIEGVEAAAPPLPGVIVGEIVERVKHPNADTLSVCQVNTGTETVQIVCGAPNARAGMKAPLATVGAKLPGGLEIKKAKLRGVESCGMLCSGRELGLSEESSGLLELPAETPTGAALIDALGLDDTILEVNLTPNRGDCMSVLGIAVDAGGREVVEPFAREHGIQYPVLLGEESLAFDYGAPGFPALAVVAPQGRIDSLHLGVIGRAALEAAVADAGQRVP